MLKFFKGRIIWKIFANADYNVITKNCQCFAEIFLALILASQRGEKEAWHKIPPKLFEDLPGLLFQPSLRILQPQVEKWLQYVRSEARQNRLDQIKDIKSVLEAADREFQQRVFTDALKALNPLRAFSPLLNPLNLLGALNPLEATTLVFELARPLQIFGKAISKLFNNS